MGGFGTGFGLQGNIQPNPKSFTTTTSKDFDLKSIDFLANLKQEPVGPSFSKKTSTEAVSYAQIDQAFSLEAPISQPQQQQPQLQSQFQSAYGQSNFNINDFNTMQRMFQTGVPNQQELSFGSVSQPLPQPVQNPISFPSIPASNPNDLNNLQLRFQTNTNSQPQPQFQVVPNPQPQLNLTLDSKSQQNPLDFFQNNMPSNFSTLSGGSLGNNFDMNSFATMQPKQKGTVELNFFDSKPVPKSNQASNDLI